MKRQLSYAVQRLLWVILNLKGDQIAKHMSSISKYNQQAVEISKRVHAERQLGNGKALNHERSIEEKFPRDYRPGFGVAMEYQKMGNQPMSSLAIMSLMDCSGPVYVVGSFE